MNEVVKELLKAPAILVNEKDEGGCTPLRVAARNGWDQVVKELLKAPEILVNETDRNHYTSLYVAAEYGHEQVVKELLQAPEILVNVRAYYSDLTPLHLAAENGHHQVVKELLEAPGILVNTRDVYGRTPHDIAKKKSYYTIVQKLFKAREMNKKSISDSARFIPFFLVGDVYPRFK